MRPAAPPPASAANSSAGEQGIQTRISPLRRSEEVSLLLHEMPKVTIARDQRTRRGRRP